MLRKGAWAAVGMIPTLIAANYMPRFVLYTFCAILLLALGVVGWFRYRQKLIKTFFVLTSAVIAAGTFLIQYEIYNHPISLYESQKITAQVVFLENHSGYWTAKVNRASCNGQAFQLYGETYIPAYGHNVKPYDLADIEFTLHRAENGKTGTFVADSVKILSVREPDHKTLMHHLSDFREDVIMLLQVRIGGEEGLFAASVLTGESDDLPMAMQMNFSRTGLSHIMAVSGLHLSVLNAMISYLLSKVKANWKIVTIVSLLFVGLVVVLAGFSVSVLRAAIMSVILLLGHLGDKEADSINSLGLALIVIGLIFPFQVVKPSYLLSGAATLGILVLSPILEQFVLCRKVLSKQQRKNLSLTCVSVSSAIFTAPILIFFFGELSVLSVPAMSIVNYPVVTVLMGTALFCCLYWIPFLGDFVGFLVRIAVKFVLDMVEMLADFDQAVIPVRSLPMILLFVIGMLAVVLWVVLHKKVKLRKIVAFGLMGIMLVLACITPWYPLLFTQQTAISEGYSASNVYINYGKSIVVDCASRYQANAIAQQVYRFGLNKIDVLVITDLDDDVSGGVPALLTYISVNKIVIPHSTLTHESYRKIIESAQKTDAQIVQIKKDYRLSVEQIRLNLYAIDEECSYFVKIIDGKESVGVCASVNDQIITQCLRYPIGELHVNTLVIGSKSSKGAVNAKLMYVIRPHVVCVSSDRRDLTWDEKADIEGANVKLVELNSTYRKMMYDYRKGKLWIYQN